MSDRSITRVRHPLRLRLLDVVEVTRLGPRLIRVSLRGSQLEGFTSLGFDDHVKVFIPTEGTSFDTIPEIGPHGPIFDPALPMPAMRDYTPHHFDRETLSLQLDFALHASGPATRWAMNAKEGDRLMIGGPRGSFVIGTGYDWHLFAGDEAALPAIRRRLLELPRSARAVVFAEVEAPEDQEPFLGPSDLTVHWIHRTGIAGGGATTLFSAIEAEYLPTGNCYAWVACESSEAKSLRALLLSKGCTAATIKASGYWCRGADATHAIYGDD